MESLLRQLAGDHPPGPMPDSESKGKDRVGPGPAGGQTELSPEEEEAAWQRAVEMMLSGEGLEALGLDQGGQPKIGPKTKTKTTVKEEAKPDFEETIRRTMEQLKAPKDKSSAGSSGAGGGPDLAALLAQLGSDPSALDGLEGEGDDDLGGLLDGMMAQLMTKEILEEPMSELAAKVSLSDLRGAREPS
jgi:peroxin-19